MLLPHIQEKIQSSPRYTAGISFSDRTIRYVEVENKKGVLSLSAFGHITIPFDVVKNGEIKKRVEFIAVLKELRRFVHPKARVVIRAAEQRKQETLSVVGFTDVVFKPTHDLFRYIFVPFDINTRRLCIFANGDTSYLFYVTGQETQFLQTMSELDLFSLSGQEQLRTYLAQLENKQVLIAGVYDSEAALLELTELGFDLKKTNIWQNLFDFNRYIPEIPFDESFEYSVPTGLLAAGIFEKLDSKVTEDQFDLEEAGGNLAELFGEHKPLTKTKEDFE